MNDTARQQPLVVSTPRRVSADALTALFPVGEIIACDFYVEGIETTGHRVIGGYQDGRILNIDHHAPCRSMFRIVSSTNLALERLGHDLVSDLNEANVVINHVDCDSILTAGILTGRLPPDDRFGRSAVAADHTGEQDDIADLLQGLDAAQARRGGSPDVELSYRNLALLLGGQTLEELARVALAERQAKRAEAARVALGNGMVHQGGVHLAIVEAPIDGEFFPALIPAAKVIIIANPLPAALSRWQMKVRLGAAAPDGLSLYDLDIRGMDPAFGGRWNAGSNRDGGGTVLSPEDYAEKMAGALLSAEAALQQASEERHELP
jgi:hypothetical protein